MRKQHEQTAGDGKILFEMQELIAIAELGVKQNRGGDAKAREQERGSAGVVAAQDEKPTAQFERDGERQQLPGEAERLHIGERRRIGGKLAKRLVQEQRREQKAAGKRSRRT